MQPATFAGPWPAITRRAAASSGAPIGQLSGLPASLHRLVLATQEPGNVTGHITSTFGAVPRAYVGLGSNLGDREATLRAALAELAGTPGVEVAAVSTFIDTEPVGLLDQPRFLNAVAVLETELPARTLLGLLLELETRFGRDRSSVPAQGPRTLDLDLLLY